MSSRPSSSRWRISWSISNGTSRPAKRTSCSRRSTSPCAGARERVAVLVAEHDRQQPDLGAVGVEDVGEDGRDDRLEAVVLQAPGRVLARGAAAEVLARDEDRVGGQVPAGLLGPVVEQELPKPVRSTRLRNCLGMIWSVSTSARSRWLTLPAMISMGSWSLLRYSDGYTVFRTTLRGPAYAGSPTGPDPAEDRPPRPI